MKIAMVVLQGVFDTGLAVLQDALETANSLMDPADQTLPRFDVQVVGVHRTVRTGHGLHVPLTSLQHLAPPDVALVPALAVKTPPLLQDALTRPDLQRTARTLHHWWQEGTLVGAACTSTFILGAAQVLNGQKATTSWWLAPTFRQQFPEVHLDETQMVVAGQGCVTAGAALGHLDLALWLVRQRSPTLASLLARHLVVDPRPSQAPFIIPDHLMHQDPLVERFEKWVREHLAERFTVPEAASALGTSERTLARRTQRVLGQSPLSYVQRLRVERAVHLLQTTPLSVERVAERVGYQDGVTLRTLLRRTLRRGVREVRQRS